MAKVLQHRRGTTAEHANFTGAAGEVTVDTTDKRLVVHDGSTKGGVPAAKKSEIEGIQQAVDQEKLDIRALIAEELAKYLPLAGGTMTGVIYGAGGIIRGKTDASDVWISGGTNSSSNSYIQINGGSRPNQAGEIILVPKTPTGSYSLRATALGALTWGGRNLVRSVNGTNADASGNVMLSIPPTPNVYVTSMWSDDSSWFRKWSDGWIEQGGNHTTGNSTSGQAIGLPIAFSNTNYKIVANVSNNGTKVNAGVMYAEITTKGTTWFNATGGWVTRGEFGFANFKFDWYACGY